MVGRVIIETTQGLRSHGREQLTPSLIGHHADKRHGLVWHRQEALEIPWRVVWRMARRSGARVRSLHFATPGVKLAREGPMQG